MWLCLAPPLCAPLSPTILLAHLGTHLDRLSLRPLLPPAATAPLCACLSCLSTTFARQFCGPALAMPPLSALVVLSAGTSTVSATVTGPPLLSMGNLSSCSRPMRQLCFLPLVTPMILQKWPISLPL